MANGVSGWRRIQWRRNGWPGMAAISVFGSHVMAQSSANIVALVISSMA
jgi:hypothetical protein